MLKVCSIQQFLENANKLNRVICFGAGKHLTMLSDFFLGKKYGKRWVWEKESCDFSLIKED